MYFNDFDYDVFTEEKIKLNTNDVREKRKGIQDKLLEINEDIKEELEKEFCLYPNKKKQHITSLLYPCKYNKGMVNWICLRYSKNHDLLNGFSRLDETYAGYQKWNNFQISIYNYGISIGLYHSVPYDSYDRSYVREKLRKNDNEFIDNLINAVESTQGNGYEFKIINSENNFLYTFSFDNYTKENVGEEFIKFYEQKCLDGNYSVIVKDYNKDDEIISTKEKIEELFIKQLKELYPIFIALSY